MKRAGLLASILAATLGVGCVGVEGDDDNGGQVLVWLR